MAFFPAHGILEAVVHMTQLQTEILSVFLPLRVSILEKRYHRVQVATSGSFLKSFLGSFGTGFSASTV